MKIGATRRYAYSAYRQVRKAKNLYPHPKYNPLTVDNDIALIELDEPVYFNDYLRPICLPDPTDVTPAGTRCYAVGWGRKDETGKFFANTVETCFNQTSSGHKILFGFGRCSVLSGSQHI